MDYTQFPQIKSADLSSLYDCIPDIWFWVKDVNSTFLWGNEAFLANFGLSKLSELLGKTDFDFSPFYLAEQFVCDDKAVLEGKSVVNRIEMVNGIGNDVNWHITTKIQLLNDNSEVIGTMGISRMLTDKQSPEIPIYRLNEIVNYIHSNIHMPISITQMAKIMNCAVSTLERTFRKQLHASPMEFIRKIKMQYACNSLINSSTSVFDIAFSLGYADQSHFIREFKRSLKVTPLQYRKNIIKI